METLVPGGHRQVQGLARSASADVAGSGGEKANRFGVLIQRHTMVREGRLGSSQEGQNPNAKRSAVPLGIS